MNFDTVTIIHEYSPIFKDALQAAIAEGKARQTGSGALHREQAKRRRARVAAALDGELVRTWAGDAQRVGFCRVGNYCLLAEWRGLKA